VLEREPAAVERARFSRELAAATGRART
jgi:hypothetical protein